MSSLTADQSDADPLDKITASLESVDDDSVVLASSQIAPRKAIRTLKKGEDLGGLVDGSPGVVLLDFYADWCGPCRKQSSELHELEDYALEVDAQIIKVNVDEHRAPRERVSSFVVTHAADRERRHGSTTETGIHQARPSQGNVTLVFVTIPFVFQHRSGDIV